MATIKIGIVGAGRISIKKHIPNLQKITGVTIVSVCNHSEESATKVKEKFDIGKIEKDWEKLVQDPNIDAVVVGTWPNMHKPIVLASLDAGKHVLVEARIARDSKEAWEMEQASKKHPELVCQVVPSPFTLQADDTIQSLLKEGFIGDILAIDIRQGNDFVDPDDPLHWRQNKEISGNNIMHLGIWYEALMRWVGEAKGVRANGKIFPSTRKIVTEEGEKQVPVGIPDHLDVIADMECGAQAHIQMSGLTGLAGPPYAALYGTQGTLKLTYQQRPNGENELVLLGGKKGDAELKKIDIGPGDGWHVEEEFVNAIRGVGKIKLSTFSTGVKYMAFTDAVVESMQTRSYVEVEKFLHH